MLVCLNLSEGWYINTDDIESIRQMPDRHKSVIRFKDQKSITVDTVDVERLRKQMTTVIPATPGFQIIRAYKDGKYDLYPIIGWRVRDSGRLEPLVFGEDSDDYDYDVVLPDGRIEVEECRTCSSIENYLEYVKSNDNVGRWHS